MIIFFETVISEGEILHSSSFSFLRKKSFINLIRMMNLHFSLTIAIFCIFDQRNVEYHARTRLLSGKVSNYSETKPVIALLPNLQYFWVSADTYLI